MGAPSEVVAVKSLKHTARLQALTGEWTAPSGDDYSYRIISVYNTLHHAWVEMVVVWSGPFPSDPYISAGSQSKRVAMLFKVSYSSYCLPPVSFSLNKDIFPLQL